MDIFAWTQYNPKIVQENTTKKFYGRYLYRLVVFCPAGRAIDSKRDISDEIIHRHDMSKNIGGWWGQRMAKNLNKADVEFLTRMRTLRHQKLTGTKMRVEEPRLQLYAESEQQLITMIQTYFDPADYSYIESVAGPKDAATADVLNTGAIIRQRDVGYTHKVIIRDGKYSVEVKNGLLNYLVNLGEETVKVPTSCSHMLTKTSGYMWNAYFYTNDPSVVTFVTLIHPGLVSNIHQLVIASYK